VYCSRKYPYSPQRGFFGLNIPPPPSQVQFRLILSFKNLGLLDHLPLRISNEPLRWGYGYFLEPHNLVCHNSLKMSQVAGGWGGQNLNGIKKCFGMSW